MLVPRTRRPQYRVTGVARGIAAAVFPSSFMGRVCTIGTGVGLCFPSFCLGVVLMLVFLIHLNWLPSGGAESWRSLVMPADHGARKLRRACPLHPCRRSRSAGRPVCVGCVCARHSVLADIDPPRIAQCGGSDPDDSWPLHRRNGNRLRKPLSQPGRATARRRRNDLTAPEALAAGHLTLSVNRMNVKYVLRDIQANCHGFHDDCSC
ncbi:hypothetical protein ABIB81_008536 [Bradyrhizobium sp. I1.7.5]